MAIWGMDLQSFRESQLIISARIYTSCVQSCYMRLRLTTLQSRVSRWLTACSPHGQEQDAHEGHAKKEAGVALGVAQHPEGAANDQRHENDLRHRKRKEEIRCQGKQRWTIAMTCTIRTSHGQRSCDDATWWTTADMQSVCLARDA